MSATTTATAPITVLDVVMPEAPEFLTVPEWEDGLYVVGLYVVLGPPGRPVRTEFPAVDSESEADEVTLVLSLVYEVAIELSEPS